MVFAEIFLSVTLKHAPMVLLMGVVVAVGGVLGAVDCVLRGFLFKVLGVSGTLGLVLWVR